MSLEHFGLNTIDSTYLVEVSVDVLVDKVFDGTYPAEVSIELVVKITYLIKLSVKPAVD